MVSMIVMSNNKLSASLVEFMESYFSIKFKKLSNESFYGINSKNKLKLMYHDDYFKFEFYNSTNNNTFSEQTHLVSQFINNEFKEEITGIYFDTQSNEINSLLREDLLALIVN